MASRPPLTHLFAELSSLEDLKIPLKGSSRLRYTCMSVSQLYIALGSNTGCVYVFGRDSLKHIKSIYGDAESKPVTVVAISPNELNIAMAASSGQVIVMEMNIERRSKPERLRQTMDHQGATVTSMVWGSTGSSLFVGDNMGKVTQVSIPSSMAKTIFTQPSQTIVRLECSIIQLDWLGSKLLASSLSRAYLLNTAKQQFSQIGKQPREGEFGACFFLEPSSNYPVIYCARPGSRMWEVDYEGNVLNTHQFKQLLATQPMPILTTGVDFSQFLHVEPPGPQSISFLRMFRIREFILTWGSRGLYIFDPINVRVVLWTDSLTSANIQDLCVVKNELYIFLESQQVRRLLFLPILHLCAALVTSHRCLLAAELVLFLEHFAVKPSLLKHIKREMLPQLVVFLKETGRSDLVERIQAMLEDVSESSLDSIMLPDEVTDGSLFPAYTTQNTGIVVVNDGSTGFGDPERRGRWSNRSSPVDVMSHLHHENMKSSRTTSPENAIESEVKSNTSISDSVTSEVERNNNQQPEVKAAPMIPSETSSKDTSTENSSVKDTFNTSSDTLYISTSNGIDTPLKEACEISTGEVSDTCVQDTSEGDISDTAGTSLRNTSDTSVKDCATTRDTVDIPTLRDNSNTSVVELSDTFAKDVFSQNTSDISDRDASLMNISDTSTGDHISSRSEEVDKANCELGLNSQEFSTLQSNMAHSLQNSNKAGNSKKDVVSNGRNNTLATSLHPPAQPDSQEDKENVMHLSTEDKRNLVHVSNAQPVRQDEVSASVTLPAEQVLEADSRTETISLGYSLPNSACHSGDSRDETQPKPVNESRFRSSQQVLDSGKLQEVASNLGEFTGEVSGAGVTPFQNDDQQVLQSRKGDEGGLRKINSMPTMAAGEEVDQTGVSDMVAKDAEPLPQSPMNSVRRHSLDLVTRTTKKKKKCVVNEVDIPLAGSTSGQRQRSESSGALRQKKVKKKESQPRPRSLDSSIDYNKFLQHPAPDSDTVSIATISSIEEENTEDETDHVFVTNTPSGMDASVATKVTASHPELPVTSEEEHGSDTSLSNSYEHPSSQPKSNSQDGEVIPPLIERLSALGLSRMAVPGDEDAASVKNIITVASKQKIASVKQRVTKFSSSTRSLIRRVTEKNPLVSRSPSESPPSAPAIHSLLPHSTSPRDETDTSQNNSVLFKDSLSPSFHKAEPSPSSACCIDLEPFLQLTEETQKQMKELSILLNPGELKAVLNAWAAELNHTLMAFHKESYHQQWLQHAGKGAEETAAASRLDSGHAYSTVQNIKKNIPEPSDLDPESADSISGNAFNLSDYTPDLSFAEENGKEVHSTAFSSNAASGPISHSADAIGLADTHTNHLDSVPCSPNNSDVIQSTCEPHINPNLASAMSEMPSTGHDPGFKSDDHEKTSASENTVPDSVKTVNSECRNSTDGSGGVSENSNGIAHTSTESDFSEKLTDLHVEQKSALSSCKNEPDDYIKQKSTDNDTTRDSIQKSSSEEDDSFSCDWSQVCHIKDPFQLTTEQHKLVSSLVWYCLESACFGNATKMFSLSLAGPKTVSAKHQASEPVPSSYGSFSDADGSCSVAPADSLLHQKPSASHSSDSQSLHLQASETQSNTASVSKKDEVSAESEFVSSKVTQKNSMSFHKSPQQSGEAEKSGGQCQNNNHTSEVENNDESFDQEKALFVRLYFHFLPYWRLRRSLLGADGKAVYATWCAVIACCQALGYGDIVWVKIDNKDITGAMDYLRSGILPNKQAFMGHVASLFGLRPTLMTEFSAEVPHQVRLADVLYLCKLYGTTQQQVIARYLTLRLGATPSHGRCEILRQMCTTQHTKLAILDCLLHMYFSYISSSSSSTSISSDVRLKASVDNSRLTPEAVSDSLACVLSLIQGQESGAALEICWQHSYWPGCLLLLKQTDQWQKALRLEVGLNDITLLNGQSPFGFTPRNMEEWKFLLHLYAQSTVSSPAPHHQSKTAASSSLSPMATSSSPLSFPSPESEEIKEDSEDGETDLPVGSGTTDQNQLSWKSLGLLAAHHLSPRIAIQLLQVCSRDDVGDVCFPAEFYNTCLQLAALERKQKLVIHNMLDKVDSYLWAKKPVHVSPQVYYAVTEERSARQSSNREDTQSYHNLFARLSAAPVTEKQLAEDPDCHWGVRVNIQTVCQVCQVLVTDTVSHLQPGVFTFKCGHVFHKFCVPDKMCPFC